MTPRIAVVIPCYKVTKHILIVLKQIPKYIWRIYIIDDHCPDNSGQFVESSQLYDPRVSVIYHQQNQGVGGAVMTGYRAAINAGADIIVKIDGDAQMDPQLIPFFVEPILTGKADYTKGNRFFDIANLQSMPSIRLFGNALLSFMAKFSTGYYDLFDPTNGYTAIHVNVARRLHFHNISRRYFFETDILFRLNTLQAVVKDIPMDAKYGEEISNLKISKIIGEFLLNHFLVFMKRIFYNYYLRGMSLASIALPVGIILVLFGFSVGIHFWLKSAGAQILTPTGNIMLALLPILTGFQFVMAFLNYDMTSMPKHSQYNKMISHVEFEKLNFLDEQFTATNHIQIKSLSDASPE